MLIAHDVWIRSAGRQGKRADLSRRDASGQSLSGVNLSASNMEFVVLVGCDLSRMDLLMRNARFGLVLVLLSWLLWAFVRRLQQGVSLDAAAC